MLMIPCDSTLFEPSWCGVTLFAHVCVSGARARSEWPWHRSTSADIRGARVVDECASHEVLLVACSYHALE